MRYRPGPRRWSVLCCAIGVVVGSVLMAAPAGAAVPSRVRGAVSNGDCEVLNNLTDSTPEPDAGGGSAAYGKQIAAAAAGFKKSASQIDDKKLKAALLSIAAFYTQVGRAKTPAAAAGATAKGRSKFSRAIGVYSKALAQCETADVTTPTTSR